MMPTAAISSHGVDTVSVSATDVPSQPHCRSLRFWLLYLTIAMVCSLALIEGLVRVLGLAPPLMKRYQCFVTDPFLPHKPRPLSHIGGRSESGEYPYDLWHNSMGFYDSEHTIEKPTGVFRILGLGDSFTYGDGATFEQTYLRRVENMLNDRPGDHPHVEIIKAGISKFFPEAEKLLLEHYGLPYQPDLVLVGFLPNDIIDTHHGIDAVNVEMNGYLTTRYAHQLGSAGIWLFMHSDAARIMLTRYVQYRLKHGYGDSWPDVYRANGRHEDDWQEVESQYKQMDELARSHHAKFVITHIPQRGPWEPQHAYPGKRLARWSARQAISFIDTFPALNAAPEEPMLYWPIDGHCTSAGYKIIAQTIFDYLIQHQLVP